jgi:hypothetical protein
MYRDLNRIAVLVVNRWGRKPSGEIVPVGWEPPEFFSARTAYSLVESGKAKWCDEREN